MSNEKEAPVGAAYRQAPKTEMKMRDPLLDLIAERTQTYVADACVRDILRGRWFGLAMIAFMGYFLGLPASSYFAHGRFGLGGDALIVATLIGATLIALCAVLFAISAITFWCRRVGRKAAAAPAKSLDEHYGKLGRFGRSLFARAAAQHRLYYSYPVTASRMWKFDDDLRVRIAYYDVLVGRLSEVVTRYQSADAAQKASSSETFVPFAMSWTCLSPDFGGSSTS